VKSALHPGNRASTGKRRPEAAGSAAPRVLAFGCGPRQGASARLTPARPAAGRAVALPALPSPEMRVHFRSADRDGSAQQRTEGTMIPAPLHHEGDGP